MSSTSVLLSVNDLAITTKSGHRLVNGVTFSLERGETLALVGESGSGKTLSSLALIGLLPSALQQSAGQILFNGQVIGVPEQPFPAQLRGKQIATVFQEPMNSMNPVLTVGEQIAEVLVRHQGLSWKQAYHETLVLLERVGINNPTLRAKQYIHQLSGGMRQRVMIASAICCKPALLIADEPTTALDATVQVQILQLLQQLQQEMAMGLLLITHDLSVVARYADRAGVMHNGNLVEQGTVTQLLTHPVQPYTQQLLAASQLEPMSAPAIIANNSPLVSLKNVTKSYPLPQWLPLLPAVRQPILQPLSLDIYRGEILGLIGESGSGKTTLGRTAIGLIAPDSGQVLFDGQDLQRVSKAQQRVLRRRAQIIFQDPYASLNPKLTVSEQIAEPVRVHRLRPTAQIPARVDELLSLVGLTPEQGQRLPSAFSGGQRQRIAIARALALEPDLLVADEAVAALDVSVRGQILNLLNQLRHQLGLSILFISHDLAAVGQLCDRVLVLYRGEVVESGSRIEVLQSPQHQYTQQLLAAAPNITQALNLRLSN